MSGTLGFAAPPASFVVTGYQAAGLPGLALGDSGASPAEIVSLTLSVGQGFLLLPLAAPVPGVTIEGEVSSTLILQFSEALLAQIDQLLAGLIYAGPPGATALTYIARRIAGPLPGQVTSGSVMIAASAAAAPPPVTLTGSQILAGTQISGDLSLAAASNVTFSGLFDAFGSLVTQGASLALAGSLGAPAGLGVVSASLDQGALLSLIDAGLNATGNITLNNADLWLRPGGAMTANALILGGQYGQLVDLGSFSTGALLVGTQNAALLLSGGLIGSAIDVAAGGLMDIGGLVQAGLSATALDAPAINLAAGALLVGDGTLVAGNFSEAGAVIGPGTILAMGQTPLLIAAGSLGGGLDLAVAPGGVMELGAVDPLYGVFAPTAMAVDSSVRIAFLPGVDTAQNGTSFGSALGEEGGVLVIDYTGNFAGTISQFAPGDRLVFPGLTSLSVSNLTANSFRVSGYDAGGVLQSFTVNALMPAGTTPAVETDLGGQYAIGLRPAAVQMDIGSLPVSLAQISVVSGIAAPISGLDLLLRQPGSAVMQLVLTAHDGILSDGTQTSAVITLAATSGLALDQALAGLSYQAAATGSGDTILFSGAGGGLAGFTASLAIDILPAGQNIIYQAGPDGLFPSATSADNILFPNVNISTDPLTFVSGPGSAAGLSVTGRIDFADRLALGSLAIDQNGEAVFDVASTLSISGDALVGDTTSAGTLILAGTLQAASMTIATFGAGEISGVLSLSGALSVESSLDLSGQATMGSLALGAGLLNLANNASLSTSFANLAGGEIWLAQGAQLIDSGLLTLADQLSLDQATLAAATIDLAGTISGAGVINAGAIIGGEIIAGAGGVTLNAGLIGTTLAIGSDSGFIDLPGIAVSAITLVGQSLVAGLNQFSLISLAGLPAPQFGADGAGGTLIDIPCFAQGTRLLTPSGYRAVESLRPGDAVITAKGASRPIGWIGRRLLDLTCLPGDRQRAAPMLIAPGAFAPGLPARPVRLSANHALLIDEWLVPVGWLANGATIQRETDRLAVTYYHVELASHDVLLAEGLAVETYRDTGNRFWFDDEAGSRAGLRPACAPLADGSARAVIRRRLHDRAQALGFHLAHQPDLHLLAGGRRLDGKARGRLVLFDLPADAQQFMIAARTHEAGQTDPGSVDRRALGACISSVRLPREDGQNLSLGAGWHEWAPGDHGRWTAGAAEINLARPASRLVLDIAGYAGGWRAPAGWPARSHAR